MTPETQATVDRVARRYGMGLITYEWALHLVSERTGATDAWGPIVVLADATRRVMRWS